MSQQIQITGGAKVRNLEGVLTGTAGVVNALGINVPSGIPQLDGSGKILVSQLPNSVMEYKGTWNAATNTPTLADGTGNQGDVYLCNVAGTANFGSGPIAFFVGDQVIYSGTIWQRASGATGTVTSVAVTESGDSLNVTGSPITTSGTINIGFNGNSGQYINGAGNLTTFPSLAGYVTSVTATAPLLSSGGTTPDLSIPAASASVDGYLDNADWTTFNNKQNAITLTTTGTSGVSTLVGSTLNIPNYSTDLSGYVPYTGATANVNLGTFDLTADVITGATGSFASNGGSNTFSINHSSGSGIALNITKGGNGEGLYINKTSGSGNAATIIGTLNATTLVKSGGTSSQFLKADGSVDASAYITLTSLSAGTGISYNNTTGAISSTITQYTDALARAAISLTTTGTSGAATYNNTTGVFNIPQYTDQFVGTVTSVAALTLGTTGTDLSSTVANGTTTPVITLNVPTASASNRGALSSADWTTFNNKQNALTNPVTGTGTNNRIAKFTTTGSTIGNSTISDDGVVITLDNSVTITQGLRINGTQLNFYGATSEIVNRVADYLEFYTDGTTRALRLAKVTGDAEFKGLVKATQFVSNVGTGTNQLVLQTSGIDRGFIQASNATLFLNSITGNDIQFQTDSTTKVRLTSAGNFIIGSTTDAGFKLDVNGQGRFVSSGTASLRMKGSSTTGFDIQNDISGTYLWNRDATPTYFGTDNSLRLTLAATGEATFTSSLTATSGNFSVESAATNTLLNVLTLTHSTSATAASGLGAGILFRAERPSGGVLLNRAAIYGISGTDADDDGDLAFYTLSDTGGGGFNEKMRIKSGGQVGIGTNNPSRQFVVSNGGAAGLEIGLSGGGYYSIISYNRSTSTWLPLVLQEGSSPVYINTSSGVSGGGILQVNGDVNINGNFKINGTIIGGGGGSGVTGSGTAGYITRWTGSSTLANSVIYDNGTNIGVGTTSTTGRVTIAPPTNTTTSSIEFTNTDNAAITAHFSMVFQVNNTNTVAGRSINFARGGKGYGDATSTMMSILADSGNVGVGSTNPSRKFVVSNAGAEGLEINPQTGYSSILTYNRTAGTYSNLYLGEGTSNIMIGGAYADNGYKLQMNGGSISFAYGFLSVYRGSSSPNDILVGNDGNRFYIGGNEYVAGSVTATGGFFDTSDSRLKILVKDYEQPKGIENVAARMYVKNSRKELGYFAQDLQEILPSAVSEGSDGFLTLSYSQVHTAKIAYLEKEVAELKELIKSLL